MANGYCDLCGNEQVDATNQRFFKACDKCTVHVMNGRLKEAFQHWDELKGRERICCGRLNYDFSEQASPESRAFGHLYFHGKGWEGTHNGTWVEYGVSFYADHARTYYLRDFDSYCDSEEYGEKIPYTTTNFWAVLQVRLEQAPEVAWQSDLCSCNECGYHYYAPNGPCCCEQEAAEG